jgi:cytochrome c oxidase subunit II
MADREKTLGGWLRPAVVRAITLLTLTLFISTVSAQSTAQQPVEIHIKARRFEFEPNKITLKKGQRAKLLLTSEDIDHGFAIEEFGINVRVPARKTTLVEFTPDRTGRVTIQCTVYCGEDHDNMTGELLVEEETQPETMKVSFDDQAPGVVIVESNGQRLRIDTGTKTVTRLQDATAPAPPASDISPTPAAPKVEKARHTEHENYDYRLINVPTPKRVLRHSMNLYFTHRFTQPLRPLDQSAGQLFGLDSFGIASLGGFYGITDKLYVSASRSPLCQRGLCRTIEIGFGYHWLDEKGDSPVALSTYASVEGDENFRRNFTYNLQAMLARSVTKHVHLFFSPAVHLNANGQRRFDPRASSFFPPTPLADSFRLDKHGASFGFGVNARIRPSVSLLFEYTPRVGFKLGRVRPIFGANSTQIVGFRNETEAAIGFGVQKDMGRHSFSLTFSNTQATTTARYNSSNLVLPPSKFIIGFNLYRRFFR